jgi:uncharacterized Zn-finger protein
MLFKINPIIPIINYYTKKEIACAWCNRKQQVFINREKSHVCSYCGKTFYSTHNINIQI